MKKLFLTLCLLCSLAASTAPTRADFTPDSPTPTVARDNVSDAHYQIGSIINSFTTNAAVKALLTSWGWDGTQLDDVDYTYISTHRSGGARSQLAQLIAVLYAEKLIGQATPDVPTTNDYPGKPTYASALARLEQYGLVISTSGRGEQRFFVTKYWENELTPANDAFWMAVERGLYVLPERFEVDPAVRSLFQDLEKKIATWGLSGQEADRQRALAAYFNFEANAVPGPGTPESAAGEGRLIVNPRRVFYAGRKIENAIQQGRASDACKSGTRVDWLIDVVSVCAGYAMQTYPLSERDWQFILGLPFTESGGGGFHIGGN